MGKITDAIKNSASFQELKKFDDLVTKDNPLPFANKVMGNEDNKEVSRLLSKNAVDEKLTPGEKLYLVADRAVDVGTGAAIGALISGAGSKAINKLMKNPAFKNAIRKIPMPKKWQDRLTASAAKDYSLDFAKKAESVNRKLYEVDYKAWPREGKERLRNRLYDKYKKNTSKDRVALNTLYSEVTSPDPKVTESYIEKAKQLGIKEPEKYIKSKKDYPLTREVLEKSGITRPEPHINTDKNLFEGILEREKPSNFDTLVKNSIPEKGVQIKDPFETFMPFYKVMQEESEAALKKANRKAEVNAKKTAEKVEEKLKKGKLAFDEKIDPTDMPSINTELINNIPNVDIPEIDAEKAAKIGGGVIGGGALLKNIFDTLTYKPERNAIKYGFKTVDTPTGKVNKAISYYDYNQGKINPKDLTNELVNKMGAIDKSTLNENQLKAYEAIDEMLLSAGTYQNVAKWIYSPEGQKTIKALTNK